jgi:hypothetical protein
MVAWPTLPRDDRPFLRSVGPPVGRADQSPARNAIRTSSDRLLAPVFIIMPAR